MLKREFQSLASNPCSNPSLGLGSKMNGLPVGHRRNLCATLDWFKTSIGVSKAKCCVTPRECAQGPLGNMPCKYNMWKENSGAGRGRDGCLKGLPPHAREEVGGTLDPPRSSHIMGPSVLAHGPWASSDTCGKWQVQQCEGVTEQKTCVYRVAKNSIYNADPSNSIYASRRFE
jgi:hypothetical protein